MNVLTGDLGSLKLKDVGAEDDSSKSHENHFCTPIKNRVLNNLEKLTLDEKEIFERYGKQMGRVCIGKKCIGSGILISPNFLLCTEHQIDRNETYRVKFENIDHSDGKWFDVLSFHAYGSDVAKLCGLGGGVFGDIIILELNGCPGTHFGYTSLFDFGDYTGGAISCLSFSAGTELSLSQDSLRTPLSASVNPASISGFFGWGRYQNLIVDVKVKDPTNYSIHTTPDPDSTRSTKSDKTFKVSNGIILKENGEAYCNQDDFFIIQDAENHGYYLAISLSTYKGSSGGIYISNEKIVAIHCGRQQNGVCIGICPHKVYTIGFRELHESLSLEGKGKHADGKGKNSKNIVNNKVNSGNKFLKYCKEWNLTYEVHKVSFHSVYVQSGLNVDVNMLDPCVKILESGKEYDRLSSAMKTCVNNIYATIRPKLQDIALLLFETEQFESKNFAAMDNDSILGTYRDCFDKYGFTNVMFRNPFHSINDNPGEKSNSALRCIEVTSYCFIISANYNQNDNSFVLKNSAASTTGHAELLNLVQMRKILREDGTWKFSLKAEDPRYADVIGTPCNSCRELIEDFKFWASDYAHE